MDRNSSRLTLWHQAQAAFLCVVLGVVLWLAIAAWFNPLQFRVFAGDDLGTFSGIDRASSAPALRALALTYHKFRPVAAWAIFLVAKWTNCDFRAVASIGLGIHTVNALIFFFLLYRKIRLPLIMSIGLTIVATFNRFATYLIMQDEAIMEGIGITFFVLLLITSLSYLEKPAIRCSLAVTLLFALLVYTHERYLVLAVPLALLATNNFREHLKSGVVLVAGVTATALSYLGIKKFLLDAPILVGTGGTSIHFGIPQILAFVRAGALNMIGINLGPAHLSLESFSDSPPGIQLVEVACALLSGALLLAIAGSVVFSTPRKTRVSHLVRIVFYVTTTGMLIVAGSVTIRQEFRWIYPAFLTFLCLVGDGLPKARPRRDWLDVTLLALILLSLAREIYLVQRLPRFFAFEAYQVANKLVAVLDHIPGTFHTDAIVIRGDVPSKEWVFLDGTFSRFYHFPALEFAAHGPIGQTDQVRLILDYDNADRNFKIAAEPPLLNEPLHQMDYSLLQQASAELKPDHRWATPTKTPAFVMAKNGLSCMALVAPVELDSAVPAGAHSLHLCFSHVYALGDGTDLEVAVTGASDTVVLLSCVVPPLANNDSPVWRKYEFAIPPDARQVKLHVFSKTDPTGDWVAFRDFSFD